MRQIGILEEPAHAKRFAAYLVTRGIAAHAEPDNGKWAVWVRDENQLADAKEELIRFRTDPGASQYQGAMREAENVLREEHKKREKAAKNIVEMRGRWKGPGGIGRSPVVFTLIAISVLVFFLTGFGKDVQGLRQYLLFAPLPTPNDGVVVGAQAILHGQVWRLVTPMFIHFGWMHIIFDMLVLLIFGRQIENRMGSVRFLGFVLCLAVASNVSEFLWDLYAHYVFNDPLHNQSFITPFGGMSGVDYGLFGYLFIKTTYFPSLGYYLSPFNTFLLFGLFFVFILRELPATASMMAGYIPERIANAAHAGGLLLGMAIAYAPLLWKPSKRP
jgi:GlpG protein